MTTNNSLSTISPRFQFAWDSTSIGALKTCPRYYQYSILEGWQPREISVHLIFGLHFHAALERYDHLTFGGMDKDSALREVVRYVLRTLRTRRDIRGRSRSGTVNCRKPQV